MMAVKKSPLLTTGSPDAAAAALAIVTAAMRAEANAERALADPTRPGYTARIRMARALDSIADRIAFASLSAPAGAP